MESSTLRAASPCGSLGASPYWSWTSAPPPRSPATSPTQYLAKAPWEYRLGV